MMIFILFLMIGLGLTNLLVNASILEQFRILFEKISPVKGLFSCMLCTGFWVGAILFQMLPLDFGYISPLFSGAIISLASHFYDILTDYLSNNIGEINETEE